MRKGFSLIEILVLLFVFAIVSLPLARLSTTILRYIPRAYKTVTTNTSMLNALEQMRKDVNMAKRFPKSFDSYAVNNETLLIELANKTVCYQLSQDRLIRRLLDNEAGTTAKITNWLVPNCKVQWRIWQENARGYALEVKTHIEYKSGERLEKKMANSHLYFVGAYQEVAN